MSTPHSQLPAVLRRSISLLRRKGGANRARALFNAIHVKGADVASAATITLLDPSCDVTGTATISAIFESKEAEVRTVRFMAAATLTYNASSLVLPGAADITTALNDVAEFYSLGSGNWICSKYTLANGTILGIVPIPKGGTGKTTAVEAKDALTTQSTDIPSASVTQMSLATGEHVTVTGTVTITAFGTLEAAGPRRLVTFDGSLTLTHDATKLFLPTEANIQTEAGDVAEFVYLGE